MKKKDPDQPVNEPMNPESWNEQSISLQDIVLSNSWALQAILNYLEEVDPNARERIWHHYELMKRQQEAALARHQASDGLPHASSEEGKDKA